MCPIVARYADRGGTNSAHTARLFPHRFEQGLLAVSADEEIVLGLLAARGSVVVEIVTRAVEDGFCHARIIMPVPELSTAGEGAGPEDPGQVMTIRP